MITSIEETQSPENQIPGVSFKALKTFPDDRGFFRELVRHNDPFFENRFAQWSHSKMAKNTVKAWHFHHLQIDWWYVGLGVIHTALVDNREESPTYGKKLEFLMGDVDENPEALSIVVRIPQGVLHGCKVLSDFAHLFYITSETYNPDDEGRIPFDADSVSHHWGDAQALIVADNDTKLFIPKNPRTALASKN